MAAPRKNMFAAVRGCVLEGEPLSRHTTFKIGGPAEYFIEPHDEDDLREVLRAARARTMPVAILGAGSNVLVRDTGARGVVIRLSRPFFRSIAFDGGAVEAGSGVSLAHLIRETSARGRAGVEFLTGIPGTLGGALAGNAGAWGKSIADIVEIVRVMDYNGRHKALTKSACGFRYRGSMLSRYIILGSRLYSRTKPPEWIESRIQEYQARRRASQERAHPNAGCIFKNPDGVSAGQLLDACGCKGWSAGGAAVSEKHANFIINKNKASSRDVITLMARMNRAVAQTYNVVLQPEIKIW